MRKFIAVLVLATVLGIGQYAAAIPPSPPVSSGTGSGDYAAGDHMQTAIKGGTGQNSSAWTGVPYVDGGVWADDNATKARRLMGAAPVASPAFTGTATAPVVDWAKGANIASASTVDLCTATGNVVDITGATGPITALGTCAAGITRFVRFTGAPTITYNGTSMILPGARSIDVEAGDRAMFVSLGSGNWYCGSYLKATGRVLGDIVVLDNSDNTTITSVAMRGQTHRITAAATPVLPAAVVGMSGTFRATTAAAFGIRANASDGFNMYNTAYGNGRAIRSSGLIYDAVYIECSTVNKWDVYPVTVFTDGG